MRIKPPSKVAWILAVVLVGVGASFWAWERVRPRLVMADIGARPSLQAERRDALQRLALELRRHPEANAVRVLAGRSAWRQGVMGYIRRGPSGERLFWHDDRFASPVVGYVRGHLQGIAVEGLVSEEPIQEAARRGGSVADVDIINRRLRVQMGLDRQSQ